MKKNILVTLFLILVLLNTKTILLSTKEACILFFEKIFISVFPFMILSEILFYFDYHKFIKDTFIGKKLSKLFNIDNNLIMVFIISLFTSTPNNSIYIKNMLDNDQIDIKTANKLLISSYFPSISFVVGTVGILMFNNYKIGIFLYLNCILNNILIGIFFRKEKTIYKEKLLVKKDKLINAIKESIIKGINNSYIILGNLILFTIIINILNSYFETNIFLDILYGTLELTNGINLIVNSNISLCLKVIIVSFFLNFNGLSILFQSFSILSNYKINIKKILIIKLIFSLINSILLYLVFIY